MDAEILTLITALVTFATAGIGLVVALRKISQIHVIVNSRMTHKLERIEQLQTVMLGEDIDIPPDPHADN